MLEDIKMMESQIQKLSTKVLKIESQVLKIDKDNEFDYQKVIATIKYLYRYYDDMNKNGSIKITP